MTDIEKIKEEIVKRIKEHKKQLRKKEQLSPITESMLKGSLGAYESLLNNIERDEEKLSPEDKMMKAIFGKPISQMTEQEKHEACENAMHKTSERDIMFNNALDIITDLTSDDPSFLCEIVGAHENEWCSKYCSCSGEEIPRICLVKALKYYRKGE